MLWGSLRWLTKVIFEYHRIIGKFNLWDQKARPHIAFKATTKSLIIYLWKLKINVLYKMVFQGLVRYIQKQDLETRKMK